MGYGCYVKNGELKLKDEKFKKEVLEIMEFNDLDADFNSIRPLNLEVYGSSYCNYHEENYKDLRLYCDGYLDFLGDDDCVWSLVFKNGQMEDVPGIISWRPEINTDTKIRIPLGDGFTIVAEINSDTQYKEVFVYLRNDEEGLIHQDLAIVAENYTYDENNEVIPIHGSYSVKVYSDPDNEDWQQEFNFGRYGG